VQLHKRQKLQSQCAATILSIRERCLARAAALRCPVHERAALLRVEGERLEDVNIHIEGCCTTFVQSVRKVVNQGL
jgi:hypothetical protein